MYVLLEYHVICTLIIASISLDPRDVFPTHVIMLYNIINVSHMVTSAPDIIMIITIIQIIRVTQYMQHLAIINYICTDATIYIIFNR